MLERDTVTNAQCTCISYKLKRIAFSLTLITEPKIFPLPLRAEN